jgi:hypothetical protein
MHGFARPPGAPARSIATSSKPTTRCGWPAGPVVARRPASSRRPADAPGTSTRGAVARSGPLTAVETLTELSATASTNGSQSEPETSGQAPSCTREWMEGEVAAGYFCVYMDVRDYELDQFSVVNNANYAFYLSHSA